MRDNELYIWALSVRFLRFCFMFLLSSLLYSVSNVSCIFLIRVMEAHLMEDKDNDYEDVM